MKISVAICAYNAERTLARTIESVIKQTYTDYEVVIVNDGSTDQTLTIAKQYQKENPSIIRIKSIPNGGLANARNHAMNLCTGDLYINLDADDYLERDTFERAVSIFENDCNIDACFYGYKFFDENGMFFESYLETMSYPQSEISGLEAFQLRSCRHIGICQGNIIYRFSMIRENNITNFPGMDQGEDIYFIDRCLLASRKVGFFTADNFCCMVRNDSMNHSKFNSSFLQVLNIVDKLEEVVSQNYASKLDQILPYIQIERCFQALTVIKRMARYFDINNYCKEVKGSLGILKTVDRKSIWKYLNLQKKIEFCLSRVSIRGYYYITRFYDHFLIRK